MPVKKVKVKSTKLKVAKTVKKTARVTVDLFDVKGKAVGKVSLPKEIFAAKVNPVLMAQAVRVYLANKHKGTASTKTRGEVHKTTAKVWRQKGTGRARHGAKSAPIWVGGGIVFGPKPRDYSLQLPKKMRRLALASALTSKLKDESVKIIDDLDKLEPKTKIMNKAIKLIAISQLKAKLAIDAKPGVGSQILLITNGKGETVYRAARNIEGVTIRPANLLTTYEVLANDWLLFMKGSIKKLEETWTKQMS